MSSFPKLSAFMEEVWEAHRESGTELLPTFTQLLKTKRYWPALQWKKFHDGSGLVLLHNTYKRTDVDSFQELYDECRSVVLDFNAPEGENVVISLANAIPERMEVEEYKARLEDGDVCQVSYEGTVISVYFYRDQWHFSTSSCPSVNASRYVHPTKRHGTMLDEALMEMFPEAGDAARARFTEHLDAVKVYFFILVHHENTHIMDYTNEFGGNYKKLVHIMTRDKKTQEELPLPDTTFMEAPFSHTIHYSRVFESPQEAVAWMDEDTSETTMNDFGIIVRKSNGKLLKVAKRSMIHREQEDMGNPNPWMNMLWVYIQNRPHYHVNNYIEKYCPNIAFPTDQYGRTLAPVYMIHTAICTLRDCLYQCYRYTTKYYPEYNRWKMNKVLDEALPKIIRFHLSQLRIIQVSTHKDEYLTPHTIYHYICHHQSMSNLMKLIGFFANNHEDPFNLSPRTMECFRVLYSMLTNYTATQEV
jgi:hypothetical protein